MAKETFTGPLIALGGLAGASGGGMPREYSDEIGPSMFWAGMAIPATGATASKDRTGPGSIPAVFAAFPIRTINAALSAGNAAISVAGNAVAGQPLPNLTTYALGRAVGTPVIGLGGAATTGIGLDIGLDTATFATNGTLTFTGTSVGNTWRYRVGQWIALLNGGVGGVTLMTQIQTIPGVSSMTVSPPPAAAVTGQIALTNRYNYNAYGASGPPSSISSMASAGAARLMIPEVGNTRGIGITGVASSVATIFDVVGIGGFGTLQTETLTTPGGAGTVWSKKTYDIFISATPRTADAHAYTVVTSDFIGFPISVMSVDSIVAMALGGTALLPANFTLIPADVTNPASSTTGDPRGGIQTTANGPGATPGTPLPFTGTVLTVDQRLNPLQVAISTTVNPGPLLGVPAA